MRKQKVIIVMVLTVVSAVIILFTIIYLLHENIYVQNSDGASNKRLGNLLYGIPILMLSLSASCLITCFNNWDDDIQKGKRYRTILTAFQIGYGIILVDLITLFSRYNLENMYYMGWTLGVDHNKIFLNIVF